MSDSKPDEQRPSDIEDPETSTAEETNGTTTESGNETAKPSAVSAFFGYLATANNVMVTVYSLIMSMVLGGILIILFDDNVRATFGYFFARPTDAFSASWTAVSEAYIKLFSGAVIDFGTLGAWLDGDDTLTNVLYPISETLTYAAPLIAAGLAVGLAFRAGLFNIGAEGQVIMGATGAAIVGFTLNLPAIVHLPLVLLAGALAGGAFGAIPGILKARTGAHEVISSIMLNYVALNFLGWVVHLSWVKSEDADQSKRLSESAQMPGLLPGLDLRFNISILVAIAAAAVVWWLLSRSTVGFRMRAVGINQHASRAAGMSVPNTFVTSMSSAGALAGIAGAIAVAGMGLPWALSKEVTANIGFDGITVALLGRAKPGGIVAAGLLFGGLRAGTTLMQPEVPIDMVIVLQAIIVIFIAAPALVKATLRLRMPEGGLTITQAKGW